MIQNVACALRSEILGKKTENKRAKSRPVQIETLKKLQNCADSPPEGAEESGAGRLGLEPKSKGGCGRDAEETEAQPGESQLSVAWVPVSDVNLT